MRASAFNRDKRLAGIGDAPPGAINDARPRRHRPRESYSAVAAQHPARTVGWLEIVGAHALGSDDAPTQHRYPLEPCSWRLFVNQGVEAVRLRRRDVEEEERRRLVRQRGGEFPMQIAFDL